MFVLKQSTVTIVLCIHLDEQRKYGRFLALDQENNSGAKKPENRTSWWQWSKKRISRRSSFLVWSETSQWKRNISLKLKNNILIFFRSTLFFRFVIIFKTFRTARGCIFIITQQHEINETFTCRKHIRNRNF